MVELREIVRQRAQLAEMEKTLYINSVNQLNTKMKELMSPDHFGAELVKSCSRDLSGEVIRNYFDLSDLYMTADQLALRMVNFQYDNEYDPLGQNKAYISEVNNYNDYEGLSSSLRAIDARNSESTVKMFQGERSGNEPFYDSEGNRYSSRTAFKNDQLNNGGDTVRDDLTGREVQKDSIAGDHVRAVKSAEYNERYLGDDYRKDMEKVYHSEGNMQWIDSRANMSKGAAESVEDTIGRWERSQGETREHLINKGYLNEEGKVPKHVQKELAGTFREIGNKESVQALKHADYKAISKDALNDSGKAITKILAGQLIYYTMPPLLFETRAILKDKSVSLSAFFHKLKPAMKRIGKYVLSKMKEIFSNAASGLFKKFFKTFFDILLSLLKETVKKVVGLAKNLVLALVDSAKIMLDKNATKAQKADGVFNLVSVTITAFVIDTMLDYVSKQFGIPAFISGPLQMIATVLISNIVLLVLKKADLFDVRYGLLVANIEKAIDDTENDYVRQLQHIEKSVNEKRELILEQAEQQLTEMKERLLLADMYEHSVEDDLEKFNRMFQMGIPFEQEWSRYIGLTDESDMLQDGAKEEAFSLLASRN
ncbi:hypothetical protein [Paenibacillus sp. FJAT-27812]|uniref:hypothetical protein n=1 Tax=Paenibacillus sp. FJAT-27812 TaxID=1684143 RepID=UPI0006A79112|nr:hypothetical protein [Paenibacillus sp. FJAT-27812]